MSARVLVDILIEYEEDAPEGGGLSPKGQRIQMGPHYHNGETLVDALAGAEDDLLEVVGKVVGAMVAIPDA